MQPKGLRIGPVALDGLDRESQALTRIGVGHVASADSVAPIAVRHEALGFLAKRWHAGRLTVLKSPCQWRTRVGVVAAGRDA